jgi:hypothetical protein
MTILVCATVVIEILGDLPRYLLGLAGCRGFTTNVQLAKISVIATTYTWLRAHLG